MQDNIKVILFTTILLFSINGFAQNWKKVNSTDMKDFYVDVDSIKKRNGLVYYWRLVDYLEPIKFSVGNANSSIAKYKVNCAEEKQFRLNSTYYSRSIGEGRITDEFTPNKLLYPKPITIGYSVVKFVCKNAR